MRSSSSDKAVGGLVVALALVSLLAFGGWVGNIVKLIDNDFASPYKSEVIRVVGVVVPIVGAVTGCMTIGDEK